MEERRAYSKAPQQATTWSWRIDGRLFERHCVNVEFLNRACDGLQEKKGFRHGATNGAA